MVQRRRRLLRSISKYIVYTRLLFKVVVDSFKYIKSSFKLDEGLIGTINYIKKLNISLKLFNFESTLEYVKSSLTIFKNDSLLEYVKPVKDLFKIVTTYTFVNILTRLKLFKNITDLLYVDNNVINQKIVFYTTSNSSDWKTKNTNKSGNPLIWTVEGDGVFIHNDGHLNLSWNITNKPVKVTVTSADNLIGLTKLEFGVLTVYSLPEIICASLLELQVNDNDLSNGDFLTTSYLPNLWKLEVLRSKLQVFPNVSSLTKLKELKLYNNEIQGEIPFNMFRNLTIIIKIELFNNYITGAFPYISSTFLNRLILNHNFITSLPAIYNIRNDFILDVQYNCTNVNRLCLMFSQLDTTLTGTGNSLLFTNSVTTPIFLFPCSEGVDSYFNLVDKGYNITVKYDVTDVNCKTQPL